MSKLKIRKIGNSLGSIFPQDVMDHLGASPGDEFIYVKKENGIEIIKYDDEAIQQMQAFDKIQKQYKNVFKALAKEQDDLDK
ncbi:putative addiction module antidote (plasmid) [Piscirickettsia salmonis]|uniref:SpoVT-AbrB domain-containing protein n=1 Tax=Piscirickettsia litoralis TaxID=1891921 RepID=A0ABX3A652_9GAMM|nr:MULTISPECIES: hypothetical protein [Piscirickettsia]ODN41594.1 hypothetical protein BGC07_15965 [Piscirickettsia litoralis]QGP51343.1 putative addiction module antidote [Piscirickettsia salmonis]QGP52084.1 putative addiction module antidote [Piscirickettsia salmonis]QGP52204.1 putative addiction module antidote [Piscirickettsia salmonis]